MSISNNRSQVGAIFQQQTPISATVHSKMCKYSVDELGGYVLPVGACREMNEKIRQFWQKRGVNHSNFNFGSIRQKPKAK